ncbi:glycosyltransferase [Pseudomonas sp. I3-I5]|uniref:glycosyltransferase n=1 Tax=Pseudomonas sp. I3-I5 TaxID=2926671 RepID=UPI001F600F3B|nr:glycosyltransferase [Pseudomonas sp. I3-I5]UNT14632.1 glycosyltransferase [Pseudomonas sp. I3-I5]
MSKSVLESHSPSLLDAEWYLATYPDVALSGMDPHEHYARHGLREGRIPRPLKAYDLESAMWGGFSRKAIPDLISLQEYSIDDYERSYACWALARWYASVLDWSNALTYLKKITLPLPPFINSTGYTLLTTEIQLHSGHPSAARRSVQHELNAQGILPDLCLAAANVCLPHHDIADQTSSDLKLHWINRVFSSKNLYPLVKIDQDAELTIDNIKCDGNVGATHAGQAKISVIMPAYNAEKFIQTALLSLLAQTWSNLEILVVDDCSTDGTVTRVLDLAKKDKRIKVLHHHTNQGSYAARNLALQHATGIFVVNHDSDDWSHPQRLELMISPLIADSNIVATMANWARCHSSLHFQTWRVENHLIEPSVSTMMFRVEAIRRLGGWDEVRVAADYELNRRLIHYYGPTAVVDVLPGIPLVFARQCSNSLTMATSTHVRTSFYGLRKLYTSLAEHWHSSSEDPSSLYLKPGEDSRPFPAPLSMLKKHNSELPNFDWLLIADLSSESIHKDIQNSLLDTLIMRGARLALFHWPSYPNSKDISADVLNLAIANKLTLVLAEQTIFAPHIIFIDSKLLEHPLDDLPVLKGFKGCHLIDSEAEARSFLESAESKKLLTLTTKPPLRSPLQSLDSNAEESEPLQCGPDSIIDDQADSLFNPNWYLERYPDVLQAGVDPREHYINNGYTEGREPGPDFNTAWYLQQCPTARSSGISPLVHYEKIGRAAGYDPRHPTLKGSLTLREGSPTILICAHAANQELYGAERSLLDVLDACNDLHINVIVSVPSLLNMSYVDALRSRAIAVTCVSTQSWSATTPPCLLAVDRFRRIIQEHNVDLVQVNTIMMREPLLAAKEYKIPSVIHAHESPLHDAELCASIGLSAEKIKTHILEASDYVIANSDFTAKHLYKPDATYVAGNIIDAKAFNIPNDVNKGEITAALVSSNLPKKGIQDFLQLALELLPDTPNLRLLLIGPHTPAIAALRTLESRGQLPQNISLVPYTATPQDAVSKANIILNLSHCQETFGRTLLEGMAAGRPVLAYRWGALPELVEDGVQGHVLEYGDIKAVANRIRQLCRNPKKIRTLGNAGRKRAKQYNLKRLSKQLGTAYEAILGTVQFNAELSASKAENTP